MAYTFKHGDRPIEGYTIQRAVGRGGFGEVYYAVSDGGREVAIKYLRDNPQIELRGVSNCINLKSPYLVSIFDVKQTTDGEYAIIMEYCSGPSLRDLLIAEPNGFAPQKAAFFMREIGKGLSYLHDRGIVHRDLKPGNIFFDDGYVKIGDYGLSKFISVSRHSGQTASVGTVHYMAPEIGSGNYSRGVDIYALGVMLYEMLLGRVPFEGSSMAEVLMKHLTTQPELDELPQPFGQIIRKALEKDPNDRYQTVDEMVEAMLDVETVRESLAGFSAKSLEGAARLGARDPVKSPIPSPNPLLGYPKDFAEPRAEPRGQPPYATPIKGDARLPERLHKRMDRISRKMDAKMAKLGGRRSEPKPRTPPPAPPASGPQAPVPSSPPGVPAIAPADRRKRMALSGLFALGLAIGLGVLIGNALGEEFGVAAGVLVVSMSGGIILSRRAVRWFGVQYGPTWSRWLINLCCCTPLIAMGAAPLLDSRYEKYGAAVMLGLLFVATFWKSGEKEGRGGGRGVGEISFACAIGTALWAVLCAMVVSLFLSVCHVEWVMLINAAVAGAVSLITQASSWWAPARAAGAGRHVGLGRHGGWGRQQRGWERHHAAPPLPPQEAPAADRTADGYAYEGDISAEREAYDASEPVRRSAAKHARLRWGITRAFWGLVAFILMGGAIVTFLIPLIGNKFGAHDVTASIIACTGCFSFMIFALRKTTPIKRHGFWRESLRPFLIALMMFGIGATITGIAREWSHVSYCGCQEDDVRCVPVEGRVALISGLVMCSIVFLGLLLFTGRKPRTPKPFVVNDTDDVGRPFSPPSAVDAVGDTEPREGVPFPGGDGGNPIARTASDLTLAPHRGVAVLVLGILGINLFPLGIAAWVMGHYDLLEMDAGRMDPSGRGLTAAGRICGIIGVVLACVGGLVGMALLSVVGASVIR